VKRAVVQELAAVAVLAVALVAVTVLAVEERAVPRRFAQSFVVSPVSALPAVRWNLGVSVLVDVDPLMASVPT